MKELTKKELLANQITNLINYNTWQEKADETMRQLRKQGKDKTNEFWIQLSESLYWHNRAFQIEMELADDGVWLYENVTRERYSKFDLQAHIQERLEISDRWDRLREQEESITDEA